MSELLFVNACVRGARSRTLALARHFLTEYEKSHPGDRVTELNLMEERLDLESIAAAFNYSRYHLHRIFASVTGFPMHTYLMRRRLTEAARMLVFSKEPVLEIALASGYETQRY